MRAKGGGLWAELSTTGSNLLPPGYSGFSLWSSEYSTLYRITSGWQP